MAIFSFVCYHLTSLGVPDRAALERRGNKNWDWWCIMRLSKGIYSRTSINTDTIGTLLNCPYYRGVLSSEVV